MRLRDYFDGTASWAELANFVQGQMLRGTSWVTWARMNDLELIREIDAEDQRRRDAGEVDVVTPTRGFETFEFGAPEQLAAALLRVMSGDENAKVIQPHTAWDDLREEKGWARLRAARMTVTRAESPEDYARLMAAAGAVSAEVVDDRRDEGEQADD